MGAKGTVYRLEFPNGKSYVGITEVGAATRYAGHRASVKAGSSLPVHNAWRKYGEPSLQILDVVPVSELLSREVELIELLGTLAPDGYNATPGGDFNPSKLECVNRKRAEASRGRPMSEAARAALLRANKGRKLSDEHRAALSAAGKGRPKSAEHRKKISEALKGRKVPEEAVRKTADALRGRKNPQQAERMRGNQFWKLRKNRNEAEQEDKDNG